MNAVLARQRGAGPRLVERWKGTPVEQELASSLMPGSTLANRFLLVVACYLAGESDEVVREGLAYCDEMAREYFRGHGERRSKDGRFLNSDRANGELAAYFIASLKDGTMEHARLTAYADFKMKWLQELNELPPRSRDTDAIWRRMVLVRLEAGDLDGGEVLLRRRRRYLDEAEQYAVLKSFFDAHRRGKETRDALARWDAYFQDARRRPVGTGRENAIQLDELLLVASIREAKLDGSEPRNHWSALRAMRGPEEIEPD